MPNNILITPNSASIQFSGSAANTIRLQVETSGSVAFYGNSGSLFSVADNLSGSLMSVNDISGLPILEVFSDNRVVMGTFNQNTLVVTGSRVAIDKAVPTADLDVSGSVFITGSLRFNSGGVTGSLFGTSSWSSNSVSSSFATSASWAPSVGGITSITAGEGLTGGTIVSSGTIRLDSSSFFFADGVRIVLDSEGVVTSSTQIDYTQIQNVPTGIVSSSTQVATLLPANVVSSSTQVNYTQLQNIPVGIVSSSTQVNYSQLQNIPVGLVSSSLQINTGSFTGSFTGSLLGTGSWASSASVAMSSSRAATASLAFTASTALLAQTASFFDGFISFPSGLDITGSLIVTGSQTITGSLNVTRGITGSLLGTGSWANNAISSSFATTASFAVSASWAPGGTGGGNAFGTISVAGQSDVVADQANDTLTLVAGTNVTITTDAGTDTITINSSGGSGNAFPYDGTSIPAVISGSLIISSSINSPVMVSGSTDSFFELEVVNFSAGNNASSDIVVSSNNTTDFGNYIDLGINSTTFNGPLVGGASDGYLYFTSSVGELDIGNASPTANGNVRLFAGGPDSAATTRVFISSSGNIGIGTTTNLLDRLTVNGSISASAVTASLTGPIINISELSMAVSGTIAANATTTVTLNLNQHNYFAVSASAAGTVTWVVTNPPPTGRAQTFVLEYTNGGIKTNTWFTNTRWPAGVAPTLTSASANPDLLGFTTDDAGANWRGVLLQRGSA